MEQWPGEEGLKRAGAMPGAYFGKRAGDFELVFRIRQQKASAEMWADHMSAGMGSQCIQRYRFGTGE